MGLVNMSDFFIYVDELISEVEVCQETKSFLKNSFIFSTENQREIILDAVKEFIENNEIDDIELKRKNERIYYTLSNYGIFDSVKETKKIIPLMINIDKELKKY